jgi:hypothetical protein
VAYLSIVAIGVFLNRPGGVELPGVLFFYAYHFLPCAISITILSLKPSRKALGAILFMASLLAFLLLWHFELRWLLDIVGSDTSKRFSIEARNFALIAYELFVRAFVLSAVCSLIFTLLINRVRNHDAR